MLPRLVTTSALLASLLVTAACPGDDPSPDPETRVETTSVPLSPQLDVLFVIDNSSSMAEEQQVLIDSFPAFIDALEAIPGGLPDVHIGIVSTNVGAGPSDDSSCPLNGDDGALQIRPGCGVTTADDFLRSAPAGAGRDTNFTGTLSEAFACVANLGVEGCGFERPLEALRRALLYADGRNAGFRRPGAHLAIVLLGDEDDCSAMDEDLYTPDDTELGPRSSFRCFEHGVTCSESGRGYGDRTGCASNETGPYMTPVAEFAQFVKDLGGPGTEDDAAISIVGIYGLDVATGLPAPVRVGPDPSDVRRPAVLPVCERDAPGGGAASAAPAVRLAQFLDAFPGQTAETSICNDRYTEALRKVAGRIEAQRGPDCIGGELADVDRATEGVQTECSVAHVTAPGTAGERSIAVPACGTAGGVEPCWQLVTDAAACPDGAHQAVHVRRGAASVPADTYQRRQCTLVAP